MRRFTFRLGASIVLAAGVFAAASSGGAFARHLKGKLVDGVYTSPRGLFTIRAPSGPSWAQVEYVIEEDSDNGVTNYDTVLFSLKDFGEVLLASVRRIPQAKLELMAKDDPDKVLSALADKALKDWRKSFAVEPVVVEDDHIATPYGRATVCVYRLPKGSFLQRKVGSIGGSQVESLSSPPGNRLGPSHPGPDSFDVLVAIVIARRDNQMISAIAEDDSAALDKDRLRSKVEEFFAALVVPEAPPFDGETK